MHYLYWKCLNQNQNSFIDFSVDEFEWQSLVQSHFVSYNSTSPTLSFSLLTAGNETQFQLKGWITFWSNRSVIFFSSHSRCVALNKKSTDSQKYFISQSQCRLFIIRFRLHNQERRVGEQDKNVYVGNISGDSGVVKKGRLWEGESHQPFIRKRSLIESESINLFRDGTFRKWASWRL